MATERTIHIAAPVDVVYRLVSDPMATPRWSSECVACRWISPHHGAAVGARYRGTCRNGRRRWTTTSTIIAMDPDALFAWDVTYFRRPVAEWSYRLRSEADRTALTERVEDRRGPLLRRLSPFITGSSDRAQRNGDTMDHTLRAIKDAAETGEHEGP